MSYTPSLGHIRLQEVENKEVIVCKWIDGAWEFYDRLSDKDAGEYLSNKEYIASDGDCTYWRKQKG